MEVSLCEDEELIIIKPGMSNSIVSFTQRENNREVFMEDLWMKLNNPVFNGT